MALFQKEMLAEAVLELAWVPVLRVEEYQKLLENRLRKFRADHVGYYTQHMDYYLPREAAWATGSVNLYSSPVKVGENRYRIALRRAHFSYKQKEVRRILKSSLERYGQRLASPLEILYSDGLPRAIQPLKSFDWGIRAYTAWGIRNYRYEHIRGAKDCSLNSIGGSEQLRISWYRHKVTVKREFLKEESWAS